MNAEFNARDVILHTGELDGPLRDHPDRVEANIIVPGGAVHVRLSKSGVDGLLEATMRSAKEVFPDVDEREGGIRLLSVDLRERIYPGDGAVWSVSLDDTGRYRVQRE